MTKFNVFREPTMGLLAMQIFPCASHGTLGKYRFRREPAFELSANTYFALSFFQRVFVVAVGKIVLCREAKKAHGKVLSSWQCRGFR
jgi:hypothetical protein